MILEQCIENLYSYNKIAETLHISYEKAKAAVGDYFTNDLEKIESYVSRYKLALRESLSIKKRGVPNLAHRKCLTQVLSDSALFNGYDLAQYKEYLDYIDTLDKSGAFPKKRYYNIVIFIKTQIDNYQEDEDYADGMTFWINSGFKWASAKIEYWTSRYGETKGSELYAERMIKCNALYNKTPEEAKAIKQKCKDAAKLFRDNAPEDFWREHSWQCIEYWVKRGFSVDEAKEQLAQKLKVTRENTHWGDGAHSTSVADPAKSSARIEYWIAKYGDCDLAHELYSDRQRTYTFDKCIERYGMAEGIAKWQARQEKWQTTMNAKSDEEKHDIAVRKAVKASTASKSSMKFFDIILTELENDGIIKEYDFFIGARGKQEYFLTNQNITIGNKGRVLFYDFCIPSIKVIVEFHGRGFHYDHTINDIPDNFYKFDVDSTKAQDALKQSVAEHHKYEYIVVWESTEGYADDVERVLSRIRSYYGRYQELVNNT